MCFIDGSEILNFSISHEHNLTGLYKLIPLPTDKAHARYPGNNSYIWRYNIITNIYHINIKPVKELLINIVSILHITNTHPSNVL